MVVLIGALWLVAASVHAFKSMRQSGMARWLGLVACSLIVLGGAGFFGSVLSAGGGLNWLPDRSTVLSGNTRISNARLRQAGFALKVYSDAGPDYRGIDLPILVWAGLRRLELVRQLDETVDELLDLLERLGGHFHEF